MKDHVMFIENNEIGKKTESDRKRDKSVKSQVCFEKTK